MTDFMLRTNTQDEMDDALIAEGLAQEVTDPDGEVTVLPVNGITLDRIGPIPAMVDEENIIVRPGDPRYHANLRACIELTAAQVGALPTFAPEPSVPYRVFI